MDIKKTIVRLLIALVLSPIVIYIVLTAAKLAGWPTDAHTKQSSIHPTTRALGGVVRE